MIFVCGSDQCGKSTLIARLRETMSSPAPAFREQHASSATSAALHRHFAGAAAALVLYDVSNASSLNAATAVWMPAAKRSGCAGIMLVGCKSDVGAAARQVAVEEGERAATASGALFMEVSALSGVNLALTASFVGMLAASSAAAPAAAASRSPLPPTAATTTRALPAPRVESARLSNELDIAHDELRALFALVGVSSASAASSAFSSSSSHAVSSSASSTLVHAFGGGAEISSAGPSPLVAARRSPRSRQRSRGPLPPRSPPRSAEQVVQRQTQQVRSTRSRSSQRAAAQRLHAGATPRSRANRTPAQPRGAIPEDPATPRLWQSDARRDAARVASAAEAGFLTPFSDGFSVDGFGDDDDGAEVDPFDLGENRGPVGEVVAPEERELDRSGGGGGDELSHGAREAAAAERLRGHQRAAAAAPAAPSAGGGGERGRGRGRGRDGARGAAAGSELSERRAALPYSTRTGETPVLNVRLEKERVPRRTAEDCDTHAMHHRAFRAGVVRAKSHTTNCPSSAAPVRTMPTHPDELVPLELNAPWTPSAATVSPSLFIDVEIGDGRVGQIAVREGSNAFALAKRFCSCHALHRRHVEPLAEMVQAQVAAYCSAAERRKEREARAANRRKLLRWQQRFTTHERHDVHEGLETTKRSRVRHAARAANASSTASNAQFIGRLHIDIGAGRTGTLVVHTGCDARQLAYGFCAAHALEDDAAVEIEAQIERHLVEAEEMDEEEAARRVKLMDASDRVAVSRQQQLEQASEEQDMQNDDGEPPLFNLEVRLSAERSEVVAVYAGEDAATLAAAFVATHSLPVKAVAKLTRLIEENVAHYATEIEVVEVNENA